jgi:asparagine synthase (glutamine-hydrolysing)
MSAIAGLYRSQGAAADAASLARMLAALAHRGSASASVCTGSAALGEARRGTPPGPAHEPRHRTDVLADLSIAAAARLDNRRELAAALGLPSATDLTDRELILRAYQRWGESCVPRLIGDFAFVIHDNRTQSLFCARDHVGVKPFYYYEAPGAFLFASEIKALLTSPLVPYRLEPLRVADHLVGFFDDPAITFYRGIRRLPPGHTLTASRAGVHVRRYWSPDPSRELSLGSNDAYADAFRECFTEAVRCRLRAKGPVGCLLSGGLDTSSIVGLARQIRRHAGQGPLDTFTAIFPGLPPADLRQIDERAFVNALVAQGGLSPHHVRGDLLDPLADLDRALWHLDEAFVAPNLYLHWALYDAARDRGVQVVLDGIDGDTTVSHGLERLAALAQAGQVGTLVRETRALAHRHNASTRALLWQLALQPLVPAPVGRLVGLAPWANTADPLARTAINREFARRVGIVERVEAAGRTGRTRSPREAHARALGSGLIPYVLELADKAAGAFGVEPRYPFLDRRLMELCLALPAEQKLRGGWTRIVLREAMRGVLPDTVRWRSSKANLAPNFVRQLLARDRDVLAEVIVDQPGLIEDYVDIPSLRQAHDRLVTRPAEGDALTVYRAVVLALWLQRAKISP